MAETGGATPPVAPTGWLLGIDTSSDLVSLALEPAGLAPAAGGAELAWHAARNQTATLLAQVERLLGLCGIGSESFAAVVVATGPGGFNALRVGMSVAKGFAFALDLPILGVGTLDLTAHPVARWGLPVRAFVTAGRGRVVFADYRHMDGRLVQQGEMGHRAPRDLAADVRVPTVLIGELAEADATALAEHPSVVLPEPGLRRRRAAIMLDLARARWQAGAADDLTALEPLYLHKLPEQAGSEARA